MIINYCPHCMANNEEGNTLCSSCGKLLNVQNEPHQLPVNTILQGRYLVGKTIGQGGFGITYIGVDLETQARVAIKEFYPTGMVNRHHTHSLELTVSQGDSRTGFIQGKEKFMEEARVLKMFDAQPNIVSVKEYFTENTTAYIVMEYIDGKSLQQLLNAKGKLSFDEAFTMLAPVIRDLGKVHEKGLIHRDISPSNIMMQRNGVMKLLDFGTARTMSQQGENSLSIVLKPGFAPEEQYRSHGEQGPWTDVYAICATMYKLITGQTPENALNRLFSDTLVRPSALGAQITPQQESVLLQGMAVHHSQRIKNMPELYDKMCAVLSSAQQGGTAGVNTAGGTKGVNTGSTGNNGSGTGTKGGGTGKPRGKIIGLCAVLGLAVLIALCIIRPGAKKDKEPPRPAGGEIEITGTEVEASAPENGAAGYPAPTLLHSIAAGDYHSAAIAPDGSVYIAGENNFEQCDVQGWTDVISVTGSVYTTAALKADGTIYISGPSWIEKGFENFTDIIQIEDCSDCVMGLRSDGRVVTNRPCYFDEVSQWRDIVQISLGEDHAAGLRADGTVIVEPWDAGNDVSALVAKDWTDIVALASGAYHLVGLRADGTVISTDDGYDTYPVEKWSDIVSISAGTNFTLGLKADGTVVCTDDYFELNKLSNVVEMAAGYRHALFLCADGTVIAQGDEDYGRTAVNGWGRVPVR